MVISENRIVSINYTLTSNDGSVLDSSEDKDPLHYLHGASNIIPGLENALLGKSEGDRVVVTVAPEDAYGERQDSLIQTVPRTAFGENQDIAPGSRFQATTDHGPISVLVTQVDETSVTVDGNHPLAGETLNFDVTVEKVREASEEEIAHGHPHEGHSHH